MCSWERGEEYWLWLYCPWIAGHLSILPTTAYFYFHQLEGLSVPCFLPSSWLVYLWKKHIDYFLTVMSSYLWMFAHTALCLLCLFPAFLCWTDNCPSLMSQPGTPSSRSLPNLPWVRCLLLSSPVPLPWPSPHHAAISISRVSPWAWERQGCTTQLLLSRAGTPKKLYAFSLQDWKSKNHPIMLHSQSLAWPSRLFIIWPPWQFLTSFSLPSPICCSLP